MNHVTFYKIYVTGLRYSVLNLVILKYIRQMKEKRENTKLFTGSNSDVPGSELDKNQEFDKSEYLEDIFYSFLGENHNNLVEDIKSWEACRFLI